MANTYMEIPVGKQIQNIPPIPALCDCDEFLMEKF